MVELATSQKRREKTRANLRSSLEKSREVKIIKCFHRVPCVGYGFTEVRDKLKDEYKNIDGKELGKLRKDGVTITEKKEFHIFCYIGDTDLRVLENNELLKCKTDDLERWSIVPTLGNKY